MAMAVRDGIRQNGLPPVCGTLAAISVSPTYPPGGGSKLHLVVVADSEPCEPGGEPHRVLVDFLDAFLRDFGESLARAWILQIVGDFSAEGAYGGGVIGALSGGSLPTRRQSRPSGWEVLGSALLGAVLSAAVGTFIGSLIPKKRHVCVAVKDAQGRWDFKRVA
jgi:hypothetical protein